MDSFFRHPPLGDASKYIRLLEILTDHGTEDEIHCKMKVRPIDDPEARYTAISYTWGKSTPSKHIYVDGFKLEVWPNCWYALWQVKNNTRPIDTMQKQQQLEHVYWIDAICINQADVPERDIQVGIMGKIYSQALSVAACIGPTSRDDKLFEENFAWSWSLLSSRQKDEQSQRMSSLFEHLFQRPWFHRLWIVQECVLAKDVKVFCGNKCIRWRMLRVLLSGADRRKYNDLEQLFQHISHSQETRGQRQLFFCDIVDRYSSRECSELHDKMYGLLSLAPKWNRKALRISYEKPLFKLLLDYVVTLASHQILNGEAEPISDYSRESYSAFIDSSIDKLAEQFTRSHRFLKSMDAFWSWRLGGASQLVEHRVIESYVNQSQAAGHYRVNKVHCHQIDSNTDKLQSVNISAWKDSFDESDKRRISWKTVSDSKHDVQQILHYKQTVSSHIKGHPLLLRTNCSDNPEFPGEMQFLLPSGSQSGDWIVPTHYPVGRAHFHLVCRPTGLESKKVRAEIVGLAVLLKEPPDSRSSMLWWRQTFEVHMFLRSYDMLAIILLQQGWLQYIDLPTVESQSTASYVIFKEEPDEFLQFRAKR